MTEKKILPHISLPIIVEGKYDKAAIASSFSATVITTGGFSVFNSKEKQALIRALGAKGVILLTDPDGAGKQIRGFLTGILPKDKIYQLYVPRIEGKERRKNAPSKEGVLGVEGVGADILRELLAPFVGEGAPECEEISAGVLYSLGLTGADGSSAKRDKIAKALGLPPKMGAKAFASAVSILCDKERLEALAAGSEDT